MIGCKLKLSGKVSYLELSLRRTGWVPCLPSTVVADQIFSIVREINALGVAILMVEQNAKQALGIAHRAYVLVDGSNRHDGTGQELLDDPEVAEMFLGGGKPAADDGSGAAE